ncbi:hypothetical protein R1sor_011558 [Riccia sorocarpa]|uniref:DUF7869 domain-containing protein n=1 Tax=Riccia sorocarpa TaxID=122646 RepID=A0ABD3I574_9MARC
MADSDDHTGDLARTTSTLPLFNSLLDQTTFIASMGTDGAVDSTYFRNVQNAGDNVRIPFKPLTPVFMLQMDNSAKDNKNVHVLAFCSELVIRGVFETVEDENLRGGFWPRTNHGTGFTLAQQHQKTSRDGPEDDIIIIDELQQELCAENNLMMQSYVGDPANRPRRAFIPLEDITEEKFVILRPDDAFEAEIPRIME